jgi:hypothetical protein
VDEPPGVPLNQGGHLRGGTKTNSFTASMVQRVFGPSAERGALTPALLPSRDFCGKLALSVRRSIYTMKKRNIFLCSVPGRNGIGSFAPGELNHAAHT